MNTPLAVEAASARRDEMLRQAQEARRAREARHPRAVTAAPRQDAPGQSRPPVLAPPADGMAWTAWDQRELERLLAAEDAVRVAVLIPAHNEAKGIADTLRSVLAQTRRPDLIWVVAHNCKDDTAAIARTFPGVEVHELNLDNGERKTAPLNWGMDRLLAVLADRDKILTMDADTQLSPGLIASAVAHFDAVPRLGAVAAHHLVRSPRGLIQRLQQMEMERGRRSAERRGGRRTCMSGMASMFRVTALRQVRARFGRVYEPWNSTEDWGLTFAMKDTGWLDRRPADMVLTYTPVTTWGALFRQRERWGRGYWETLRYFRFRRFTAWPWLLQMWFFASTASFFVFAGLEGSQHHAPRVTTWLLVVTTAMTLTAVVTVRRAGIKAMLLAALILPEMAYIWVINFATIWGITKNLLRMDMQWADVRER
jgi:poly-beta-1,6-N-acetyl-D-glucosamine synthase